MDFEIITALITPFHENGKVNYPALKSLIENQLKAEIDTFVLFGTTGEGITIPLKEQKKTILKLKRDFRAVIHLWIGISETDTEQAAKRARSLSSLKVEGLLVLSPAYLKTNDEGVVAHFTRIADASFVPVYLYYVPKRTGQYYPAAVYRILKQHPNIRGVKDASGSVRYLRQCLAYQSLNFQVYCGDDAMLMDALEEKAGGIVSVASNLYPRAMKKIVSLYQSGQEEEAKSLLRKYETAFSLLFIEPNPIPVKYLMNQAVYHLPLYAPGEETVARLKQNSMEDLTCDF